MLLSNNRSDKDYQFVSRLEVISNKERKYKFHQEKKGGARPETERSRSTRQDGSSLRQSPVSLTIPGCVVCCGPAPRTRTRSHCEEALKYLPHVPARSREANELREISTTGMKGNTHFLKQRHTRHLPGAGAAGRARRALGLWPCSCPGEGSDGKLNLNPVFYLKTDSKVSWCFWPLQISVI